jgi:uncharacterized protein
MRAPRRAGALCTALLLLAGVALAVEPVFPPLTGRVVDEAKILSPQTQARLDEMLAQHERETGQQIVVVTLKSLQGYPIEDFGYRLGRNWGIGQKGRDNGALLIVAPKERKVRIEVGYGLEDRLTDAQSRVIIEQVILPHFRAGDFSGGVLDGAAAMLRAVGGAPLAVNAPGGVKAARPVPSGAAILILIILAWVVFWRFLWPLLLVGPVDPRWQGRRGSGFWYGGSGGGFSGGGSGGGFSGGGGSFGGGGASGGW